MGIKIVHGTPSAYTELGKLAGQAEKRKEEIARSEREIERGEQVAAQIRSMKFQEEQNQLQEEAAKRARQVAQEWEIQKMSLNSQQQFQHELRLNQTELDREARSKEWELKKMEIRSYMDFQKEEQDRSLGINRTQNEIDQIEKEIKSGKSITGQEPQVVQKLEQLKATLLSYKTGQRIQPYAPKEEKPLTYGRQKAELESAMELESYTQQDLIDLGLNPAEFPGVGGNQIQEIKPIYQRSKKTGQIRVSYDGGVTWQVQ